MKLSRWIEMTVFFSPVLTARVTHSRFHTNENKAGLKRHWRVIIVIGLRMFVAICPLSGPNRHIQTTVSRLMDIHFYPLKKLVRDQNVFFRQNSQKVFGSGNRSETANKSRELCDR